MRLIFSILSMAVSIYILLIFIRIIVSWFISDGDSKPLDFIRYLTDPFIDWWRNRLYLRLGFLDLSPVVGIAALSILRTILSKIAHSEKITIGNILGLIILSIWSIASFVLGFCVIVLILRIFAYLANRDIYTPFWKAVESITQPLLYETNRLIFGKRIVNYLKGIIISTLIILAVWIIGGYVFPLLARLLFRLPF